MEWKYFKPKSLTWWSSVTPLLLGLFMAFEPMHGMTELVASINTATGSLGAYALINLGIGGIGLRGAIR